MGRRRAQTSIFVDERSNRRYERDAANKKIEKEKSIAAGEVQHTAEALRKEREAEEEYLDIEPNEKGGSFTDQFFATLERTVQQKKRDWVSTLLEMLIPILFVVGTIILWAAFGDEKYDEQSYLNYSTISGANTPGFQSLFLCNNESMGSIPGVISCDAITYGYNCSGDESALPYKGLCYNSTIGADGVLAMWMSSLLGNGASIPSLDSVIIFQWLARKASSLASSENAAAITLAASGLTSTTRANAILDSGLLYFAPAANIPDGLIKYLNQSNLYFSAVYGGTFDTVEEARNHVKQTDGYHWGIIEIDAMTVDDFSIRFHMNSSALPPLTSTVDIKYPGGFQFDRGEMYIASGVSSLQKLLYEYYLENYHEFYDGVYLHLYLASFGTKAYKRKLLLESAAPLIGFILVLSFLYPVSQLAKKIVLEKELRIREAMLIMGLNSAALYLCWFAVYALQYIVECLIMVLLMKLTYVKSSDALILFMTFYVFALTTIPLAGLISAFFSKARLASMLAPLIFFVLSVPVFAFTSASWQVILGVSVLSPTAFASAVSNILTLETATGFSANDFNNQALSPESMWLYVMLGADFVFYYILMLYFDAVLPKDWGTVKHPLFFIIDPVKFCCCWCCKKKNDYEGNNEDGRAENGVFEDVDDEDATVRIVGLRKVYKRGGKKFTAVNNLYWSMKDTEISVLLGHNGAGKSTTMNMMTGMTTPDEGDCYINGYSVRDELGRVRQQIGFCPQHNILWPELSCREHLEYFGKIKGLYGAGLEDAVRMTLREVDLLDKVDYKSDALSGGQKRKLSVAIAFVGRSALVFLDEPTAGMDVAARRYTWELLRRMSEAHTIMLTTHYMDEADLLGHRIGIMSRGSLQCSGSSMFLKSRLGVGYRMSITTDPQADAEEVDRLVTDYVPSAEAAKFDGVEIEYKLPMSDVGLFPKLLAGLEQNGEAVGVRGFSLAATSLEEVFLQIAMEDMKLHKEATQEEVDEEALREEEYTVWNCELMTSANAVRNSQFKAMMVKRFWNAIRDRRMQCFQVVCPVVCILLAMLLTLVNFTTTGSVDLTAEMFGEPVQMEVSGCESFFPPPDPTTLNQGAYAFDNNFETGQDMSLYTMDTSKSLLLPRYTSIFCGDKSLSTVIANEDYATFLFYNTSAYHASGLVVQQVYTNILQHLTGDNNRSMKTSISSMPKTASDKSLQGGVQTILIGAIVMIPFTFLPSNPVAWVVKERECKARHLQNVSGLNFYIYWVTTFMFDMCAYFITLILVFVIFLIFQRKEYIGKEAFGPTVVMFVVYGFCSTAAAYVVSFAFSEHSTAQTVTMAVSFVAGFLLVMMVFILSLVDSTTQLSKNLQWAFRIVPSYCVGESIINLAMDRQKYVLGLDSDPWGMAVVGWPCIYMAAEFPVFLFLTLFIDHPRRRMWGQRGDFNRTAPCEIIDDEDSDVEDERNAVYEAEDKNVNEDIVRVVDLRKVYKNGKVAVRNLAFSILPDEVFGFLGTNGAGKTTAISMLCQEFIPSSGCAYVCGYDVVSESEEALRCIGYCPQFDATLDLLTVEEHLYMYAGIRGINYKQRDTVVSGLMRLCEILEYRKTTAAKLSGGNRRKLSVALALIGSPQIVFLDEPSAGMDPVARRSLWTAIQKVSSNCSVVLTTHHLEEVEALADTVAIMADGALRCIGDKMHLKTKYGSGFEMSIRIADEEMRAAVEEFVERKFPNATFNEFKGQRFVYALPQDTLLSETFELLQRNKERYGITDYSISQTSIEQVFLRISEEQELRQLTYGEKLTRFTTSHATAHNYHGNSTAHRRSSADIRASQDAAETQSVVSLSTAAMNAYKKRMGQEQSSRKQESDSEESGSEEDSSESNSRSGSFSAQSYNNAYNEQPALPQYGAQGSAYGYGNGTDAYDNGGDDNVYGYNQKTGELGVYDYPQTDQYVSHSVYQLTSPMQSGMIGEGLRQRRSRASPSALENSASAFGGAPPRGPQPPAPNPYAMQYAPQGMGQGYNAYYSDPYTSNGYAGAPHQNNYM